MRLTMPKYPRTVLPAALVSISLLLPAVAAWAGGPDHPATFEKLKSLAGTWSGRMEDPLEGPPVTVRYQVASNGQAVIEHQNPGQSYEMITVYYLAGGKLQATHYCAAGNQPAFRLDRKSTDDLAILEFDGGTGFDPDADGHVHRGEIRFLSPDRIEHRWFHYVGPKELGSTHWFLEREIETTAPPPDCSAAEYRQFDFWIGTFDVRTPDGQLAGHNVIEPTLDGCALTEHWTASNGSEGRSLNFYDRRERRWHQVWIDDHGRPLRLAGGVADGSMVLEGAIPGEDGSIRQHRIRWTPQPDASVRRHWESSTDDGANWATIFDGRYLRRP